jgi:hypothetical protein
MCHLGVDGSYLGNGTRDIGLKIGFTYIVFFLMFEEPRSIVIASHGIEKSKYEFTNNNPYFSILNRQIFLDRMNRRDIRHRVDDCSDRYSAHGAGASGGRRGCPGRGYSA